MQEQLGANDLNRLLASHLLPGWPDSALARDDLSGFLDSRASALQRAIETAT